MPLHAWVAGATGYTGQAVVAILRARGVPTTAHVRPDSSQRERWETHFRDLGAEVDTTPWVTPSLTEAVTRVAPTHVFALLGTTRARMRSERNSGRPPGSYDSVDFGLSHLLWECTWGLCPPPRFVYLSAMGVSARATGAYYAARWKMETALSDRPGPHLIARPAFISGQDRDEARPLERVGARIFDSALGGIGRLGWRRIRDQYRSMDAQTLGAALVHLALSDTQGVVEAADLRRAALQPTGSNAMGIK